jgi:serine/threonine protein kinase
VTQKSGDLAGKILGTCTLEKQIGRGGMGAVYLARQAHPSRYVAVKVLLLRPDTSAEVYQEFLARFRREADLIARLEHTNIMPIYEYGEHDGITYLVMPYSPGGSLRDALAKYGACSFQRRDASCCGFQATGRTIAVAPTEGPGYSSRRG